MTQTGTAQSARTDITINGDPELAMPSANAVVLDGDYAIAAGGSRSTAVLGAVTFDPTGTIVGGTVSFIGAPVAPTPEPAASTTGTVATASSRTATTMIDDGNDLGAGVAGEDGLGGSDAVDPGISRTAAVTDCTVTGGAYSLAGGGGGEARLQLDCAGSSLTATWRIFVTGTQGLAVAQQFRAVQLESLPGATDPEVADLTLTLR